jgi:hypothetical protein
MTTLGWSPSHGTSSRNKRGVRDTSMSSFLSLPFLSGFSGVGAGAGAEKVG